MSNEFLNVTAARSEATRRRRASQRAVYICIVAVATVVMWAIIALFLAVPVAAVVYLWRSFSA